MKRIAVTGATGFIGRHLMDHLRQRGFEIHAIGRHRPDDDQVIFHESDLLDGVSARRAIAAASCSHLLHLAWDVEPGTYWRSPSNLDWVSASLQLLRGFAENGGRRAVIAGTCAEYLWGPRRFVEEKTPSQPTTLYGVSKDALRRILRAYGDIAPLSVGWGRIFFLYGPGEKQGRLVSDAIRLLLSKQELPTSHGLQRRDFMHVSDVAGAFAALVDSEVCGTVNIASGRAISVRSILESIARETGAGDLVRYGARPLRADEPEIIEGDVTRLFGEVGFRPRYEIGTGLTDTIFWWRQQLSSSRQIVAQA
jgi:nucleoside-diphosphate-sugar epimerase